MAYQQDITVKYGDFTFPVPSPFVSRNYSNERIGGDLWVTTVEVSIIGEIALLPEREEVDGNKYGSLKDKRNEIASAFAGALGKNFQTLQVTGHGTDFSLESCSIQSVDFSSSTYRGLVPYTIVLIGYDNTNQAKAANYGVISPTDKWDYSEADNGIASVAHTVSAKGYSTQGKQNAFLNAKQFVEARRGVSNKVTPSLINNIQPDSALILNSVSEQVDRFSGSYSVTENYSFATNESQTEAGLESGLPFMQTANILLTYTLSVNEEQGGDFISMTLSGEVVGTKDTLVTWDQIKKDFRSRNFYDLANKAYKNYIQRIGTNLELNKSPLSFSIGPDEEARKISFSLTYDNNDLYSRAKIKNSDGAYFDYNISFQHDNVKDIIDVSCSGTVNVRGALNKKNSAAKRLLDDEILANDSKKIRDEALRVYRSMFPSRANYDLSPRPSDVQIKQNTFNGTIAYSASFSDRDFPENSSLLSMGYSVEVSPAMQEYKTVASCLEDGHYLIYDLDLKDKREQVSINAEGLSFGKDSSNFKSSVSEINLTNDFLRQSFIDGDVPRLESENKVENIDTANITYRRAFSHEKSIEDITLERKLT